MQVAITEVASRCSTPNAMSVILTAGVKKTSDKVRRKVIRKAGYSLDHVQHPPEVTKSWELDVDGATTKLSFSRDNLHVWVDHKPVQVTAYITDQGMDVDLYFRIVNHDGHIFSDVEGKEMLNTLYVDDIIVAQHRFKEKSGSVN